MVMEVNEKIDLKANDDIIATLKKYSGLCSNADDRLSNENEHDIEPCRTLVPANSSLVDPMDVVAGCSTDSVKDLNIRISQSHSKKVIKHALRQQAKRRRKNTTIASGNMAPLSHIVVQSVPAPLEMPHGFLMAKPKVQEPATMREVLASIPGFSIKPRKRTNKKLSTAAQLEQTKEGCIDLETPDSILVNTNLRSLLNKHTFFSLPPLYQYKLMQLLPSVDRTGIDSSLRLSTSGLNNEFFARACLEWTERLSEGEFTPENQQKLKAEAEREKSRLDPWKLKHFEPIWGERHESFGSESASLLLSSPDRPPLKTTIKLRPSTSLSHPDKSTPALSSRRLRTVGAVTRAITSFREETVDPEPDMPLSPFSAEKRPADPESSSGGSEDKKMKDEDGFEYTELQEPEQFPTAAEVPDVPEADIEKEPKCVPSDVHDDYDVLDSASIELYETHINIDREDSVSVVCSQSYNTEVKDEVIVPSPQPLDNSVETVQVDNGDIDNMKSESEVVSMAASFEQEADESLVPDDTLVHDAFNDSDLAGYEPNVVHEDDVIHTSAILDPAHFIRQEEIGLAQNTQVTEISEPLGIDDRLSLHEDEPMKLDDPQDDCGEDPEEMEAALFAAAVANDGCCWDVVDSSTGKLISEVPLSGDGACNMETTEEVEVIPMQEELDVRLEEGSFPVAAEDALAMDWPYTLKVASAVEDLSIGLGTSADQDSPSRNPTQYQEYSTGQAVKLELEVTLTPEAMTSVESEVTTCGTTSMVTVPVMAKTTVATVIPPTTIVCLPSIVTTANVMNNQSNLVSYSSGVSKTATVASSSALPYLALSGNTPMRALPTQMAKAQGKLKTPRDPAQAISVSGRNSRGASNKPPPGAVNLERSYQICQAVIQNSPNRDQLRCQLKPPPALLTANTSSPSAGGQKKMDSRAPTQYGVVTSSRNGPKPFTPPLPAAPGGSPVHGSKSMPRVGTFHPRQQSPPPIVVRHMFTSSQGIPVTMAVLPQGQVPPQPELVESPGSEMGHVGQYILVQRTGVGDHQPETVQLLLNRKAGPPRASSAPPSNNQMSRNFHSMGRGRPASVDVKQEYVEQYVVHCPSPGTQAVTRREQPCENGGIPPYGNIGSDMVMQNYAVRGDAVIMDPNAFTATGQVMQSSARSFANVRQVGMATRTESSQCECNLKAMIMCKKCGAFCHDDCIGPARLCVVCLVR